MRKQNRLFLLAAISFFLCMNLLSSAVWAELQIPAMTGPVVDQAGMISAQDERNIEQILFQFKKQNQAQVQVLTMKDLGGETIEKAAIEIVEKWQLGDQVRDDGILILVAAKERQIRIEVGQGLEGIIPDAVAKRIISDVMVPSFREISPSQGILLGTLQVLKIIEPEMALFKGSEMGKFEQRKKSLWKKYEGIFFLIFIGFFFISNLLSPRSGRGIRRGMGGWGPGGMGGFGGRGGFGGGGWSGGGGGFSGGGASGGW